MASPGTFDTLAWVTEVLPKRRSWAKEWPGEIFQGILPVVCSALSEQVKLFTLDLGFASPSLGIRNLSSLLHILGNRARVAFLDPKLGWDWAQSAALLRHFLDLRRSLAPRLGESVIDVFEAFARVAPDNTTEAPILRDIIRAMPEEDGGKRWLDIAEKLLNAWIQIKACIRLDRTRFSRMEDSADERNTAPETSGEVGQSARSLAGDWEELCTHIANARPWLWGSAVIHEEGERLSRLVEAQLNELWSKGAAENFDGLVAELLAPDWPEAVDTLAEVVRLRRLGLAERLE